MQWPPRQHQRQATAASAAPRPPHWASLWQQSWEPGPPGHCRTNSRTHVITSFQYCCFENTHGIHMQQCAQVTPLYTHSYPHLPTADADPLPKQGRGPHLREGFTTNSIKARWFLGTEALLRSHISDTGSPKLRSRSPAPTQLPPTSANTAIPGL